ncbi:flagellar basal body-associated protein FliL [bacterium 1XD42-8]|jgi:flagellar basal body-associated protein FliL|nr:flagellar basal body-associated FliL family protein [Lachnospiraceae bacterium]RKJ44413.1 flagellar basal body-associated protein FliL [bacterium 1XD42-8]
MKKNMMSIIILALLVVNIALTAVMMFSVVPAANRTNKIVKDVAAVMNLELSSTMGGSDAEVPIEDTLTYEIADKMTIPLRKGADEKDHYAVVSISLAMNTKNEDYEKFGSQESMLERESLIKNEINEVVGSYTLEEAQTNTQAVQTAILDRIQNLFGSKFIYKVVFRDVIFQ